MADKQRRWLSESLQAHLIPSFVRHGFKVIPLSGEEVQSREFRTAFPFGRLRRESARAFDLVEIQLDKHGNAAFRLNIGIAPPGGIQHTVGPVAQEDVRVHHLNRYFEAYSWPWLRRWFAVRHWFGPAATKADYEALVTDNLGLVQEVEDVLRVGKQGPHIRVVEM